ADTARQAVDMGFDAIKTEGADHVLGWRSPNHVYETPDGVPVLLRNYRLSDDIGYRFSNRDWDEWPLTAEKYAAWLDAVDGDTVNLFLDYETFGEHHWPGTGILSFLKHLPGEAAERGIEFVTPSEAVDAHEPVGTFDVGPMESISWADMERDTSAWLGNGMQQHLFEELKWLEPRVKEAGGSLLEAWRRLTTSDHLYYLCDKGRGDGDVHSYFSRFDSPEEGYVAY
ncbi:MAG: alpha-amylase, partial [Candidatus Nanohaloarchaea archaeon]